MKSIIETHNLSKRYQIRENVAYYSLRDAIVETIAHPFKSIKSNKPYFWALSNLSFKVNPGEVIGVIGKNGAGKSTLLKILSRITPPTGGEVILRGRTASLLEIGTGFHPELTGRENIYLNGAILGMTRKEVSSKFDEIVNFSGVERFLSTPVKHYSSGMYMRLAFAVAAHLEPEILIVDEVLSVGDAEFQKKSLGKMQDVSKQGRTVIFVSHNLSAIVGLCKKVILLDNGKIEMTGDPSKVIAKYLKASTGVQPLIKLGKNNPFVNSCLRLLSVSVEDENGRSLQSFDITKPLKINVVYEVLEAKKWFSCLIVLRDAAGLVIFSSPEDANQSTRVTPRNSGYYKSTCVIPGNFLTEGLFSIRLLIFGFAEKTSLIDYQNCVTFHVHDKLKGSSVRGTIADQLRGVIRPKLKWERAKIAR